MLCYFNNITLIYLHSVRISRKRKRYRLRARPKPLLLIWKQVSNGKVVKHVCFCGATVKHCKLKATVSKTHVSHWKTWQ